MSGCRKLAAKDDRCRNVSVIADLTKRQREEEHGLRKDAERLNANRTEDETKN